MAIVGGFAVYWWLQPDRASADADWRNGPASSRPATQLDQGQSIAGIGAGRGVWVRQFDPTTGALSSAFRAEEYNPQPGNTVKVTRPQAEFYDARGKLLIRIVGQRGVITHQGELSSGNRKTPVAQTPIPTRGVLHEVVVELFAPPGAIARPYQILRLENVAFDNDAFRIYTQAFVDPATGRTVPADRVPVVIDGDDYRMRGYGLTIRWNERDRRLQLLEIAHGQVLEILHPAKAYSQAKPGRSPASFSPAADPVAAPVLSAGATPRKPLGMALAATTRSAEKPALITAARPVDAISPAPAPPGPGPGPAAADKPSPLYRATFHDQVTITQAGQSLALADQLSLDFQLRADSPATNRAAAPSQTENTPLGNPPTDPRAIHQAIDAGAPITVAPPTGDTAAGDPAPGARSPGDTAAGTPAPGTRSTTMPATRGDEPPLLIRWTGKLVIRPTPVELRDPPAPGAAILTLTGSPARIRRGDGEIRCARARVNTATRALRLEGDDESPVELSDGHGAVIRTQSADFSQADGQATLHGRSSARFPVDDDARGRPAELLARWSGACALRFGAGGGGEGASAGGGLADNLSVEHARFDGDVSIQHPQLSLRSGRLELWMDRPPASGPTLAAGGNPEATALRRIHASEAVVCILNAPPAPAAPPGAPAPAAPHGAPAPPGAAGISGTFDRRIECDDLDLTTGRDENGRLTPRTIRADGAVVAREADQSLRAEHLLVTLAPAPATAAGKPAHGSGKPGQGPGKPAERSALRPIRLESLLATEAVRLTGKNGAAAAGNYLLVSNVDGREQFKLMGPPDATVTDGRSTLTGPHIELFPRQSVAYVYGAGSLQTTTDPSSPSSSPPASSPSSSSARPAATTAPAMRPVRVTWTKNVEIDGNANLVEVRGDVAIRSEDAEKTPIIAKSQRLRIDLAPETMASASTRPTIPTSAAAPVPVPAAPGVAPAASTGDDAIAPRLDFLRGRTVRRVGLEGDVEIESTRAGESGELRLRRYLAAPSLSYDPVKCQAIIPAAGKVLLEDYAPATSATPAAAPPGRAPASTPAARGATAIQWDKQLIYDEAAGTLTLQGPVHVAHVPAAATSAAPGEAEAGTTTYRMEAGELTAYLADRDAGSAAMNLKRIVASKSVTFTARGVVIDAAEVEYDPLLTRLTARGTDRAAVTFTDGADRQVTASRLVYNLRTGELEDVQDATGRIR